jgi:hypothetical protein
MKNPLKTIMHWAKNDPNPMGTLDKISRKIAYQKRMVRENPMKLHREMDPNDYETYIQQMKDLRAEYWRTRGFDAKKEWKDNWMVPLMIWNIDPDYWHEVTRRKKNLIHTEYLVSEVKPQFTKAQSI